MALESPKQALQSIGAYDIVEKIAEGGMGTVYKGRHRGTGLVVAIKIVPPSAARNPVLLKRFEREFNAANGLEDPNIVKAIEFDGDCPTPFLVMEFVDGETVGQRIERDGRMPEDESIRLIGQVCKGLYKAHKKGLVHRDVKPDNILINREGQAKLTDLGLVKDATDDYNLTKTGRGLGTPHFMAPEQFKSAKNADARCDVYSLGATLYMMVTGQTPFGNCTALDCYLKKMRNEMQAPRELVPTLSERVDWAIRRAMSPNPDQRPATCREFVEDMFGRTTRPSQIVERAPGEVEMWYLVYQDEFGQSHTVKGATDGIRRALRDGLLGDTSTMTASRSKQGPFQELKVFPEFRDLLIRPEAMPSPKPQSAARPVTKVPEPPATKPAPAAAKPAPPPPPPAAKPTPPPKPAPPADPFLDDGSPMSPAGQPNWRQGGAPSRTPAPAGHLSALPAEPRRRLGFDIVLWMMVLAGSMAVALIVFKFFPPG
jgi:serine/threonine protein kinase